MTQGSGRGQKLAPCAYLGQLGSHAANGTHSESADQSSNIGHAPVYIKFGAGEQVALRVHGGIQARAAPQPLNDCLISWLSVGHCNLCSLQRSSAIFTM